MKTNFKVVAVKGSTEIRQYPGSLGFQVWRDGAFYTFMPTLALAKAWL